MLHRRFAEHLSAIHHRRHAEDYRVAVDDFARRYPTFPRWYEAILEPFANRITFEQGSPQLEVGSLAPWRRSTSRIDPDALLALALARRTPSDTDPVETIASLDAWGYYVGLGDHGLRTLLDRGVADIHVHFEASDPLPLLWLRLATGRVGVKDLQYFSDATLKDLGEDEAERERRTRDREILADATRQRRLLLERIGRLPAELSRYMSPSAAISEERTILLAAWKQIMRGRREILPAFDRYLFAKSLFIRRHQQRSGQGPGLTRFRDFLDRGETLGEKRAKKTKPIVRRDRLDRMLSLATQPASLRVLELRIAPQDTIAGWHSFFRVWEDLTRVYRQQWDARGLTIRFVVHFIRRADGNRGGSNIQFGALRQKLDRQSAVLALFRHMHPERAAWIVGIDVANLERGCPPEIFAPYLQLLRGDDRLAEGLQGDLLDCWRRLDKRKLRLPPPSLPTLGLTFHAGEDFHHPVDGLRSVGGLVDNVLKPGDRIGHGLAVGWDTTRFARDRGLASMPIGVLFDNLVWLRRETAASGEWSGKCQVECDKLIDELRVELHPDRPTRMALEGALDERFKSPCRARSNSDPKSAPELTLADACAFDEALARRRSVFADERRLRTFSLVEPLLPELQRKLARQIRDRGVLVEANPSSNLITGAVDDLRDHPMLACLEMLDGHLTSTVCTDDPGVFGTNIEIEYGLMLEAMLERRYDRGRAIDLLDRARKLALDHAFHRGERRNVVI